MYQFFVDDTQVSGDSIFIEGSDVNHIRNVLRMKNGEKIRVSAGNGHSWFCRIAEITETYVKAQMEEEDEAGTELPVSVTLYQGLPKSDKMELIIQKSVELGVRKIVPVSMKNCVMKLDEKKAGAKIQRWQAIAESAAKQSKRTIIPVIGFPETYGKALEEMAAEADLIIVPYENERGMEATRELLCSIKAGQNLAIVIGPEGGFADDEIKKIKEKTQKAKTVSLGRRILRTETAGPAALAMLVYQLDL